MISKMRTSVIKLSLIKIQEKIIEVSELIEKSQQNIYSTDNIDIEKYEQAYYEGNSYFNQISNAMYLISDLYYSQNRELAYLKRIIEADQDNIDIDIDEYNEEQRKKLEHLRKQRKKWPALTTYRSVSFSLDSPNGLSINELTPWAPRFHDLVGISLPWIFYVQKELGYCIISLYNSIYSVVDVLIKQRNYTRLMGNGQG